MKLSKQQLALAIVIAGILLIAGVRWFKQNSAGQDRNASQAKGNPGAPIKIVEYIDFQCPACARGAIFLKSCFQKYPDKFYLEMKNYPLAMHPHSFLSAIYAQCAARQGKFWPFHDLLIERQQQWSGLVNAAPVFHQMARELELDIPQLEVCLQDAEVSTAVIEQKEKGTSLGIQSTPTYFINNKMVVGTRLLEEELTGIFKKSGYGQFICSN